jgi:uroporphyrinogen III methyltransferase/synthase
MPSSAHSHMPLADKTVVLVCSALKAEALADGLRRMGACVRPFSAIEVCPVRDSGPLDHAIRRLEDYSWLIFTSAHAVLFFANRLRELGVSEERFAPIQVCAIGPGTAKTAAERGFRVSLTPGEFVAEGVIKAMAERMGGLEALRGKRIMLPRAMRARDVIPSELEAAGAIVDIAVCYETVEAKGDPVLIADMKSCAPDVIVFTSSSNVTGFVSIIGEAEARPILGRATLAALGPITAKTLAGFGNAPEIVPLENSIPGLLEAIRRHFRRE